MAYANMKGDMSRWTKIYAIFWYRHRAKHILMMQRYARWRSRDLVFLFQDSRIRVKRRLKWTDRSKVDGPSTTSFKTSRLWAKSEIKIYSKVDAVNFRRAFALSFLAAQFHKWTSTFELNSYLVLRLAGQFAVGAKIWNLKKVILVGNKENISWKWKMR